MEIQKVPQAVSAPVDTRDEGQVTTPENESAVGTEIQPTDQSVNQVASVSEQELRDAVDKLSEIVGLIGDRSLAISVDKDLSQIVLKVINDDTEEVVRQIPSEEVLTLMKKLQTLADDYFGDPRGLLLEKKI